MLKYIKSVMTNKVNLFVIYAKRQAGKKSRNQTI